MEIKIATIRRNMGDLIVSPMAKSFYCRHCLSLTSCKGHRNGFFFLLKIKLGKSICYIIDGYGESESETFIDTLIGEWELVKQGLSWPSGTCRTYKPKAEHFENLHLHITVGGWRSYYPLPFKFGSDEEIEERIKAVSENPKYQIDTASFVEIMKIVQKNLVRKYHLFDDINIDDIEFEPAFIHLLPLLKTYKRSRVISVPGGAEIKEIPNSFTAYFELDDIVIRIPKRRKYHYTSQPDFDNYFKYGNFAYLRTQEKVIVYYIDKYSENFSYLVGREKYKDIVHNTVRLRINSKCDYDINKILSVLFNFRLGDVIFLPENHPDKFFVKENFFRSRKEQFTKLRIYNAHLEESENGYLLRPEDDTPVVVFHPEHGTLVLSSEVSYEVLSVTYQHD